MPADLKVCPNCDSVVKEKVCLNCGYIFEETVPAENSEEKVEQKNIEESEHTSVASIFAPSIEASQNVSELIPDKKSPVLVIILLLIFLTVIGLGVWRFIFYAPEYFEPIPTLSSSVLVNASEDGVNEVALDINGKEKTIAIESNLIEG